MTRDDVKCPMCGTEATYVWCNACGGTGEYCLVDQTDDLDVFDDTNYADCPVCNGLCGYPICPTCQTRITDKE